MLYASNFQCPKRFGHRIELAVLAIEMTGVFSHYIIKRDSF